MMSTVRRRLAIGLTVALTTGGALFIAAPPAAFVGVGAGVSADTPGIGSNRNPSMMRVGEMLPADVYLIQVNSDGESDALSTPQFIKYVVRPAGWRSRMNASLRSPEPLADACTQSWRKL